jgi:mRNA interferase HigB
MPKFSVRVISRSAIRRFLARKPSFADADVPLRAWFHEARRANWRSPAEVKRQYASASILKNSRVVFNIAGNKYRLIAKINYDYQVLYIRFIGTHAHYDRVDAEEI